MSEHYIIPERKSGVNMSFMRLDGSRPSHAHPETASRKTALLEALRTAPTLVAAYRAAGVSSSTVDKWRKFDPTFRARFNAAKEGK